MIERKTLRTLKKMVVQVRRLNDFEALWVLRFWVHVKSLCGNEYCSISEESTSFSVSNADGYSDSNASSEEFSD